MTRRLVRAALTLAAVAGSFCVVYALCRAAGALPGPAILSALLAMSGARREGAHGRRQLLVAPIAIACTVFAAAGVAWLLRERPILGAAAFVAGIFASIYLRNFGELPRRIGSMIALPLIAILVAPARADAPGGPLIDLGLLIAAGLVALIAGTLTQRLATFIGPPAGTHRIGAIRPATGRGLTPTTRLALQMTLALAAAFVAGFTLFASHWGWCVLTAFLVASGARSRGDVLYKGLQRLAGAIAGTLCAALVTRVWLPSGVAEAAFVFAVLFGGLALRDVNYAYWAMCMTLILAILAHPAGTTDLWFLGVRLEAILAGAACSVAAAWFVYPIKTTAVIRRRLADALVAFDAYVEGAHHSPSVRSERLAAFEQKLGELDDVAVPVRLHRRILGRRNPDSHPATWIDLASQLHAPAQTLDAADERQRTSLRRAIGLSRKAIGAHGKADAPPEVPTISAALERLHATLAKLSGGERQPPSSPA